MSRGGHLVLAVLLALPLLPRPAAAGERSLLFTAAERRMLACAQGAGQGMDRPGAVALPDPAAARPDGLAHLSSLVFAGERDWEFRLNGQVARPGRLPPGILAAQVSAESVTLVRLDPADGTRRSLTLRVGERRPWPRPAPAGMPSQPAVDQDKTPAPGLSSGECPPMPAREARP